MTFQIGFLLVSLDAIITKLQAILNKREIKKHTLDNWNGFIFEILI